MLPRRCLHRRRSNCRSGLLGSTVSLPNERYGSFQHKDDDSVGQYCSNRSKRSVHRPRFRSGTERAVFAGPSPISHEAGWKPTFPSPALKNRGRLAVKPPPPQSPCNMLKTLRKFSRQVCRSFQASGAYSFHDPQTEQLPLRATGRRLPAANRQLRGANSVR